MTTETFWMVWNPAANAPRHRHDYEGGAIAEAERLARLHPGQEFFILEATHLRTVSEPMKKVKLEYPIPF